MRVFISHSLKDKELLVNIEKIIRSWGYEPVFSEQTVHAGTITDKIKKLMDSSDFVLILYTDNVTQSNFVHHEIGYFENSNKPIFIIKGNNVSIDSGLIYGYDSIEINANGKVNLSPLKKSLDEHNALIKQKIISKKRENVIMTIGTIGLALLFGSESKSHQR